MSAGHGAEGAASLAEFYQSSAYARFPQEHRAGGTLGAGMVFARQEAIEITDPAVPQIAFVGARRAGGSGEFDFGDGWRTRELRAGVVDPQPAFTECHLRIPDVDLLALHIDHRRLAERLDEVGVPMSALDPLYATFEPMPRALALIEGAWDAMGRGGPGADLAVDGAVSALLGMMLDRAGRRPPPPPRLDDRRLQRVVDYVEAHLDRSVTAGELAGVAAVSLFHFTRMFRAATGTTPLAYATARRVARAQALLADPAIPLAQVAFATGFASQSHFGEVFRRHTGLAPGAWRAQVSG